jgi:hypothetical protein
MVTDAIFIKDRVAVGKDEVVLGQEKDRSAAQM